MITTQSLRMPPAPRISEKVIYEACAELYRLAGCRVKRFSQARAARQTPGIPDLKLFAMRVRKAWWHEVKTPTGRQSLDQVVFQQEAEACGEVYVLGGIEAARAQLIAVGLARMERGRFVLVPGGSGTRG